MKEGLEMQLTLIGNQEITGRFFTDSDLEEFVKRVWVTALDTCGNGTSIEDIGKFSEFWKQENKK